MKETSSWRFSIICHLWFHKHLSSLTAKTADALLQGLRQNWRLQFYAKTANSFTAKNWRHLTAKNVLLFWCSGPYRNIFWTIFFFFFSPKTAKSGGKNGNNLFLYWCSGPYRNIFWTNFVLIFSLFLYSKCHTVINGLEWLYIVIASSLNHCSTCASTLVRYVCLP